VIVPHKRTTLVHKERDAPVSYNFRTLVFAENESVCRAKVGPVAACVLIVGCASPVLHAEEELEQVLVTARKRLEQVWQVPFSVDVQTQSQLAEKRATDGMSA
jgi:hypothetical protein